MSLISKVVLKPSKMHTPTPTLTPLNIPSTPVSKNLLFDPLFHLNEYERILNEYFMEPREVLFNLGWDVDVLSTIKLAKSAGYTTMVISYGDCVISNYVDILEVVNYENYLDENRGYIEDIKHDIITQNAGDVVIDDASDKIDLIIDVFDLLKEFNLKAYYSF